MTNSLVLGSDIGGSHISAALVDLKTKKLVKYSQVRKKVNSHGSPEEIIQTWSEAIKEVFSFHPENTGKIGIGMPGPFDYEEGISFIKDQDKYEALYGLNVKKILARTLGIEVDNIRMINDAGSFLQGESFGGSIQEFEDAIGITLGTGLGSARFHNGLAEDADLWKMPFLESIAEDYISTRWFLKRYYELASVELNNVKELSDLVRSDYKAMMVFEEFGKNLASFLQEFILLDDPQVIVIGGNISNASDLFFPVVKQELRDMGFNVPIKKAVLGEDGAIIGAASCWYEKFLQYC